MKYLDKQLDGWLSLRVLPKCHAVPRKELTLKSLKMLLQFETVAPLVCAPMCPVPENMRQ